MVGCENEAMEMGARGRGGLEEGVEHGVRCRRAGTLLALFSVDCI